MKQNFKISLILFLIIGLFPLIGNGQTNSRDSSVLKATSIAKRVISAMGGDENFEETNFIGWTFFGSRKLLWDNQNDRVRVDYIKKELTIITSLNSEETKLFMNGSEITDADSLIKYSTRGKRIWANDSYWLLMPFKLLDEGVNLKYVKDTLLNTVKTSILEMTFENVGFTPENKYWIYVDMNSYLITQWDFYNTYTDITPEFSNTWGDYKKYDKLLISGDRGVEGKLENIYVVDEMPSAIFETK